MDNIEVLQNLGVICLFSEENSAGKSTPIPRCMRKEGGVSSNGLTILVLKVIVKFYSAGDG